MSLLIIRSTSHTPIYKVWWLRIGLDLDEIMKWTNTTSHLFRLLFKWNSK